MADNKDSGKRSRIKTVYGFYTDSVRVGYAMQFLYYGIALIAVASAYWALKEAVSQWPTILIFIAASVVAGAPVGFKLMLYARKEFAGGALLVVLFTSAAAMFFNQVGFYREIGVSTIIETQKLEATETINTFNVVARKAIADAKGVVEQDRADELGKVRQALAEDIALYERRVVNARHTAIDERDGVKSDETSGVAGEGQLAKQQKAASRREADMLGTNKKLAEETAKSSEERVNAKADARIAHLDNAVANLDKLVEHEVASSERKIEVGETQKVESASAQIAEAESFKDLVTASRRANGLMAAVASEAKAGVAELSIDVKDVQIVGGNSFELYVLALGEGKVAAWLAFFLGFMFEWLEPLSVYLIRNFLPKEDEDEDEGDGPSDPGVRRIRA